MNYLILNFFGVLMKRLRNVGIYYTIFGIVLAFSFIFFNLWPISLLGVSLLILYLILKYVFNKKAFGKSISVKQLKILDFLLIISPFLYVLFIVGYRNRPYNQIIVLPKDYEGVVAIQYDTPNGQEKNWIGGFMGFGASRHILVDSTGIAKTQFSLQPNAIPILGLEQSNNNRGGLKIYFEDDLHQEIISGANGKRTIYENKDKNKPSIYFTGYKKYPLIIFVLAKSKDYLRYFMSEETLIENYKKTHQQQPSPGRFFNTNILNNKYEYYYELDKHYKTKAKAL